MPPEKAPPGTSAAAPAEHGLRAAYRRHVAADRRRQASVRILISFIGMFLFLRALTYGQHSGVLPIPNAVTSGGLHIHHFVWGILILLVVGFVALAVEQSRWHPWLAILFGAGAALVIDEFALWLRLEDVYWSNQGRLSVDAAIVIAALLGLYVAAEPLWRALLHQGRGRFRPRA